MESSQTDKLALAIHIAARDHLNQKDKAGRPYILHTLAVMYGVESEEDEVKQIAVLHDWLEDTDGTIDDLAEFGFSQRVVDGLSLMYHNKKVSYMTYIRAIATNRDTILVKMSDLRHNMDPTRMKGTTEKDHARNAKYAEAYAFLKAALAEIDK